MNSIVSNISTILFISLILLLLMSALGVCAFVYYLSRDLPGGEIIELTIPRGATGREIARILRENNLICHEYIYLIMAKLESPINVKYGIYEIPKGLSPKQIIDILKRGPVKQLCEYTITIPEGLTNWQIALLTPYPEEFLNIVNSPDFIKQMGFDAPNAEGFLFPATYCFDKVPDPYTLAKTMVENFKKELNKLFIERKLSVSEVDLYKILKIASLVEEEAKLKEEKPIIARVIFNRLKKNMFLQIDATIQYALKKYGEPITNTDKEVESPYNTYRKPGLPPTPICNPGIDSIISALDPSDGDFLYYVANSDGKSHTFSKTYEEHLRALKKYKSKNSHPH